MLAVAVGTAAHAQGLVRSEEGGTTTRGDFSRLVPKTGDGCWERSAWTSMIGGSSVTCGSTRTSPPLVDIVRIPGCSAPTAGSIDSWKADGTFRKADAVLKPTERRLDPSGLNRGGAASSAKRPVSGCGPPFMPPVLCSPLAEAQYTSAISITSISDSDA